MSTVLSCTRTQNGPKAAKNKASSEEVAGRKGRSYRDRLTVTQSRLLELNDKLPPTDIHSGVCLFVAPSAASIIATA